MQQGGGEGRRIHAQVGEDAGDGQRMTDVRVAAAPYLPGMGGLGELVRAAHQAGVSLGMRGAQSPEDGLDRGG